MAIIGTHRLHINWTMGAGYPNLYADLHVLDGINDLMKTKEIVSFK